MAPPLTSHTKQKNAQRRASAKAKTRQKKRGEYADIEQAMECLGTDGLLMEMPTDGDMTMPSAQEEAQVLAMAGLEEARPQKDLPVDPIAAPPQALIAPLPPMSSVPVDTALALAPHADTLAPPPVVGAEALAEGASRTVPSWDPPQETKKRSSKKMKKHLKEK